MPETTTGCAYKKYTAPSNTRKSLRVVGLDPSLRHFGYVILDGGGLLLESGTIDNKAPKSKETRTKCADFSNVVIPVVSRITDLVLRGGFDVCVVREDYAYAASSGSDALLKELGGVLEWELTRSTLGLTLHALPIQSVKKWACGNGNADKEDVEKGIKKYFGVTLNTEHEYDAYGCATLALAVMRKGLFQNVPEKNREVLVGLKAHTLTGV